MTPRERECFILGYFYQVDGPFKSYHNPQRDDGVFVGQDKPIAPYSGVRDIHGGAMYPATPQGARVFPHQLDHDTAAAILKELNQWHQDRLDAHAELMKTMEAGHCLHCGTPAGSRGEEDRGEQ